MRMREGYTDGALFDSQSEAMVGYIQLGVYEIGQICIFNNPIK